MKRTPVRKSLVRILLCLLIIAACLFRSRLLPLSGIPNFFVTAVSLLLVIILILDIYKAICSIVNELDP